jgi:hypothetical protein
MSDRSPPGGTRSSASAPGSEATSFDFANQRKTRGSLLIPPTVGLNGDQAKNALRSESELEGLLVTEHPAEEPADRGADDRRRVDLGAAPSIRDGERGTRSNQNASDCVGHNHGHSSTIELFPQLEQLRGIVRHGSPLEDSLEETASEHIRNVLQMIGAAKLDSVVGGVGHLDLSAVERRLQLALEQLEGPRVLTGESLRLFMRTIAHDEPVSDPRLELAPALVCKYCSCSEWQACSVDVASLSADDRDDVAAYHAERGAPLPPKVGCWWISLDPPVCSNPHCAELHRAQLAGVDR